MLAWLFLKIQFFHTFLFQNHLDWLVLTLRYSYRIVDQGLGAQCRSSYTTGNPSPINDWKEIYWQTLMETGAKAFFLLEHLQLEFLCSCFEVFFSKFRNLILFCFVLCYSAISTEQGKKKWIAGRGGGRQMWNNIFTFAVVKATPLKAYLSKTIFMPLFNELMISSLYSHRLAEKRRCIAWSLKFDSSFR